MALSQMDDLARAKVTYFFVDDPNPRQDGLMRMRILPWCQITLSDGTIYNMTVPSQLQLGSGPAATTDDGTLLGGDATTGSTMSSLFAGVAGGVVPTEFVRAEDRCPINFGQPYPSSSTIGTAGALGAQGGKDDRVNDVHFMGPV